MSASDSWKLLVFRDGKRIFSGPELLRELLLQIEHLLSLSEFTSPTARDEVIDALLRAGELECALADREHGTVHATRFSELTNELARALVSKRKPAIFNDLLDRVPAAELPSRLTMCPPEGFCYYALHPLDYADALERSLANTTAAAVVGIRSIGTTLSAVAQAWFQSRGIAANRITVRPTGHPFDRTLSFTTYESEWVKRNGQRGAHFWIVDEGPGLSGSSFLAVAEALVNSGVEPQKITLVPSSEPNFANLFAPDAAARWSRFKTIPVNPTRYIPAEAIADIGWGGWRKRVFAAESDWPGVWPWTERRKYLSADGERIFRFAGHGRYGKAVRRRSELLDESGWGPPASSAGDGFSVSPWIAGERPKSADRDTVLQLARYCAFRAKHFQTDAVPDSALQEMAQVNLERALEVLCPISLPVERPVIADARMMPYEWIEVPNIGLYKLDAASHGDDHFYPGPTDIAWDLAGAITEWKLDREAQDLLVSEYRRITGDNPDRRLPAYLIAYCAFRSAFTRSAAQSVSDPEEAARFTRDSTVYQERLCAMLRLSTFA